jgi:O-antigen ligase
MVSVRKRLFLGGLLGVLSGSLILIYTTRMLWLTTLLGVLVIILTTRRIRWILVLPTIAVLAFGSVALLQRLAPKNIELAIKKGDRFSRGLTKDNYLEQLDTTRYAELLNFVDTNRDRYAILWGSGYGSYYKDFARPFPADLKSSFPAYSLRTRQYFSCHNYVFLMLFKHGVLGLLIISALWLVPGWRCFKILRKHSPADFSIVYYSMVAFLPTSILTLYWSGKGDIISGFCIAFYLTFSKYCFSQAARSKSVEAKETS